MKRYFAPCVLGLVLLGAGFAGGRFFQHCKTGYHHEVRDTKEYQTGMGPVRWIYVTESVGLPFLDSGTTLIEFDGRTIYKAQRGFQESCPFARNVNVTPDKISWDDGDYRYDLAIRKMKADAVDDGKPSN